jgi:hypothetical protein
MFTRRSPISFAYCTQPDPVSLKHLLNLSIRLGVYILKTCVTSTQFQSCKNNTIDWSDSSHANFKSLYLLKWFPNIQFLSLSCACCAAKMGVVFFLHILLLRLGIQLCEWKFPEKMATPYIQRRKNGPRVIYPTQNSWGGFENLCNSNTVCSA